VASDAARVVSKGKSPKWAPQENMCPRKKRNQHDKGEKNGGSAWWGRRLRRVQVTGQLSRFDRRWGTRAGVIAARRRHGGCVRTGHLALRRWVYAVYGGSSTVAQLSYLFRGKGRRRPRSRLSNVHSWAVRLADLVRDLVPNRSARVPPCTAILSCQWSSRSEAKRKGT